MSEYEEEKAIRLLEESGYLVVPSEIKQAVENIIIFLSTDESEDPTEEETELFNDSLQALYEAVGLDIANNSEN